MKKLTQALVLIISFSSFSQLQFQSNVTHVYGAADASIEVFVTNGSGSQNYNYYWYDSSYNSIGSNSSIISELDQGVYFLKVEDILEADTNNYIYTYFWIGKYGASSTLSVQPNGMFGIDACVRYIQGHATIADANYGNYENMLLYTGTHGGRTGISRQFLKFQYNGLKSANISNSSLKLWGFYYRVQPYSSQSIHNEILIKRIKANYSWEEHSVTHNSSGAANSGSFVEGNSVELSRYGGWWTSANANYTNTVDMTSMINGYANEQFYNNGMFLELKVNGRYRSQYFRSSDYTVASERPKLTISFTIPNQSYTQVKEKIDGSYTTINRGNMILNIAYRVDHQDMDGLLSYKVYDMKRNVVLSDANKPIGIQYGSNKITINGMGYLQSNKYYILEVTDEKNKKKYLRFKTT